MIGALWAIPLVRKAAMALAVVLAFGAAHVSGRIKGAANARHECKVADLKAELAERARQQSIATALQVAAQKAADLDRAKASAAQNKVDEYEKLLEMGGDCPLSDTDIERLLNIR